MMPQFFYFSSNINNFLFGGVVINTTWEMTSICLGMTVISLLIEGMKLGRKFIFIASTSPNLFELNTAPCLVSSHTIEKKNDVLVVNCSQLKTQLQHHRLLFHTLNTGIFIFTITLNYIVMLAVMTFNVYFLLSAVIGATLGYFLFGLLIPASSYITTSNLEKDLLQPLLSPSSGGSEIRDCLSYGATGTTLRTDEQSRTKSCGDSCPKAACSSSEKDEPNISGQIKCNPNVLKVEVEIHASGHESV